MLQLGSWHKGYIAETGPAEAADNGLVGLIIQPVYFVLYIFQFPIRNGLKFLNIILRIKLIIIDGLLPDDGIKVEPAFGHSTAGRCRFVALRIHQDISIWLRVCIEVAGH